jgi:hypothetical protein
MSKTMRNPQIPVRRNYILIFGRVRHRGTAEFELAVSRYLSQGFHLHGSPTFSMNKANELNFVFTGAKSLKRKRDKMVPKRKGRTMLA